MANERPTPGELIAQATRRAVNVREAAQAAAQAARQAREAREAAEREGTSLDTGSQSQTR